LRAAAVRQGVLPHPLENLHFAGEHRLLGFEVVFDLRQYLLGHRLMAFEDGQTSVIFVEDQFLLSFVMHEDALLVEAIFILEEKHTIFGRSVGTSEKTVFKGELKESHERECRAFLTLEGHISRVLRLYVGLGEEFVFVNDQFRDLAVLAQEIILPENLFKSVPLLWRISRLIR